VRIAQVSLLTDTVVPWPASNAGRAVAYLIEELVGEHEVTLFAPEEWETSAELVRLRRIERQESLAQFHRRMVRSALRGAQHFDILHLQCDRPILPAVGHIDVPCIVTLHAPCAIPDRIAAWPQSLSHVFADDGRAGRIRRVLIGKSASANESLLILCPRYSTPSPTSSRRSRAGDEYSCGTPAPSRCSES